MAAERVLRYPSKTVASNLMPFLNKQYYLPSASADTGQFGQEGVVVEPVEVGTPVVDTQIPVGADVTPPVVPHSPFDTTIKTTDEGI